MPSYEITPSSLYYTQKCEAYLQVLINFTQ